MKTTRRSFLKAAAVGAGAIAISPAVAKASSNIPDDGPNEVGLLYDSTLCVGCKACVYSCRKVNFDEDESSTISPEDLEDRRWHNAYNLDYRTRTIIKMYNDKEDTSKFAFVKLQCNHCKAPGCVSACPVSAMMKDHDTGIVSYHKGKCIGCRYCQIGCPFNVPSFEWHRSLPKLVKCELCYMTKLYHGEEPACSAVCPTKAVIYGKRSDLIKEAKRRVANGSDKYVNKVYGEKDYGGLNCLTIAGVDFDKLGLPALPERSFASTSEKLQHTIYKKFIAPVALYGTLAAVAIGQQVSRNREDKQDKDGGQ